MINNQYSYQTLYSNNARIPAGTSVKNAKYAAHELIAQAINSGNLKVPAKVAPGLPEDFRRREYANEIYLAGDVQSLPDDSGLVVLDGHGSPVYTNDNKKFTMSFKDINDPTMPHKDGTEIDSVSSQYEANGIGPFSQAKSLVAHGIESHLFTTALGGSTTVSKKVSNFVNQLTNTFDKNNISLADRISRKDEK
jgi:hypothetical protein